MKVSKGRWVLAVTMTVSSVACESASPHGPNSGVEATVVVKTETGLIGRVSDMALGSDGRLYATDDLNHQVLVVDPSSDSVMILGRLGSGPSELQRPTAIRVDGDRLTIFDSGNGRLVTWTSQGGPVDVLPAKASAYAESASIDPEGVLVTATGGFGSGLVMVVDAAGHQIGSIGSPVPLPVGFTPDDIRKQLRLGEVPALFQNNVVAARAVGGAVIVAMMAMPEVRLYDPNGSVVWAIRLKDPVHAGLQEVYTRMNLDEPDGRIVHPFRFFVDIQVADSTIWLLGPPEADHIVIWELTTAAGKLTNRYAVQGSSGVTAFVVAPKTMQVFLADNDRAQITVAPLVPSSLVGVTSERITSR